MAGKWILSAVAVVMAMSLSGPAQACDSAGSCFAGQSWNCKYKGKDAVRLSFTKSRISLRATLPSGKKYSRSYSDKKFVRAGSGQVEYAIFPLGRPASTEISSDRFLISRGGQMLFNPGQALRCSR